MNKFDTKSIKTLLYLIGLVIVFEGIYLLTGISPASVLGQSVQKEAGIILEKCLESPFPPSCYDEEIPKLMDKMSLEDVIEVTKVIQGQDRRYLYCHVLGHYLSEREMKKDPTKWKEVLSKAPPTFCNNGFLHGAMIARFNTDVFTDEMVEEIKPDLMDVCEDRPDRSFVEVERSMCYHAVGHLAMYASNADPAKAVEICGEVSVKDDDRDYKQTCTEGVFMQIYQPLEPEDFALIADIAPTTQEEARDLCSKYDGEAYDACNREAWPLWRADIMKPGGVERFCSYTDDDLAQRKCTGAVMNMVTATYISDNEDFVGLNEYCLSQSKETYKRRCYANSATRLIQIDPRYTFDAVRICKMAEENGLEMECYRDMSYYGAFSFVVGSKEIKQYCSALPEEWRESCLSENGEWR